MERARQAKLLWISFRRILGENFDANLATQRCRPGSYGIVVVDELLKSSQHHTRPLAFNFAAAPRGTTSEIHC